MEEGELELFITQNKRITRLAVAGVGHVVCLSSVIAETPAQHSVRSVGNSCVIFVDGIKIREYMRQNPESCLRLIQMLGSELVDLSANTLRTLHLQRSPKNRQY